MSHTQNGFPLGDIAVALSQLASLIDQQQFTAYWSDGLNTLCLYTGALAARLYLCDESFLSNHRLTVGQIPEAYQLSLDNWEEMRFADQEQCKVSKIRVIEWSSVSDVEQDHQDHIDSNLDKVEGEATFLHLYIIIADVIQGAVSLIFEDDPHPPVGHVDEPQWKMLAELFQLFAANAIRAYNLQHTQVHLEQATMLFQISQAITSTLDLKTVFHQTTELAASILNAQAATLFSIDTKRHQLVFMIAKGSAAQALEEKRIPLHQGVAGWVATNGESLVVNNARDSELFNSEVDSQTGFSTRNILCVPLRMQDRTIGVLEVLNKEGDEGFTPQDVRWLSDMGQHIAIALENAQLYENLRREQERIIKAQEEVRNHLARELHDNTAQMLSLIIMNLDLARQLLGKQELDRLGGELERIEEYAKQANREVRTLLFELRPIILESRGLVPALHAYHRQLQASMTSKIHLDATPLGVEISLQGASIIFSIIQEAVNNIRKHARAKNIWIRVYGEDGQLHFNVEDDGVGFDLSNVLASYEERGSFGLLNMRERAAMLAGYVDIQSPRSNISNGTIITGYVPLSSLVISQEKLLT